MRHAIVSVKITEWDRETDEGTYKGRLPSTKHVVMDDIMSEDSLDDLLYRAIDKISDEVGFCIKASHLTKITFGKLIDSE